MNNLLYIQASPRMMRSRSTQVGDAFVEAFRRTHPDDQVTTLELSAADLPTVDGDLLDAKYALLHGREHTPEQARAWRAVELVISQFKAAHTLLLTLPMWNFGIPYRLKQYIDVLVQPGYTFTYDPETGYRGLVAGIRAVVVYARGGEYATPPADAMDFQKPYVEAILGFIGITDITGIVVEPTLAEGPDVAGERTERAKVRAARLAESW
jgi:FMN-dependent NADH-azoreductase